MTDSDFLISECLFVWWQVNVWEQEYKQGEDEGGHPHASGGDDGTLD